MEDEMLEKLILQGYVEPAGIDVVTGEMLYSFTAAAKKDMPNLERQFEEEFHRNIMFFWQKGYLDMNVFEENPVIRINPVALDESVVASLSAEHRQALKIIIDALRIQ
jgi:hypothetical protein